MWLCNNPIGYAKYDSAVDISQNSDLRIPFSLSNMSVIFQKKIDGYLIQQYHSLWYILQKLCCCCYLALNQLRHLDFSSHTSYRSIITVVEFRAYKQYMFTSKFQGNIFSSNILRFTLCNLEIEHNSKERKGSKLRKI